MFQDLSRGLLEWNQLLTVKLRGSNSLKSAFMDLTNALLGPRLIKIRRPEAEFKEFELRLKFEMRLKHGLFHLKLYSVFRNLSQRSIGTCNWRCSNAV